VIKLKFKPFDLILRHPFTVATASRTSTPIILTELEYQGITGFGEAAMPPYLGESHATVEKFLSKIDLSKFADPFSIEEIVAYIDSIEAGNNAAKASVDIALHDLVGKLQGKAWHQIWGYNSSQVPETSLTIGIDTPEMIKTKVGEASLFNILKIKLGGGNDKEIMKAVRSVTNKPLYIDANQGWTDRHYALDMACWLKELGAVILEQPMPKEQIEDIAWLTQHSPIPIIADEGIRRLSDLKTFGKAYSGVNIKLMKSTGMHEAHKMVEYARSVGLKVMIGCMTETSCAISAAAQLSPACDYTDLDGPFLITNNPFAEIVLKDGKLVIPELPGIGVRIKV